MAKYIKGIDIARLALEIAWARAREQKFRTISWYRKF